MALCWWLVLFGITSPIWNPKPLAKQSILTHCIPNEVTKSLNNEEYPEQTDCPVFKTSSGDDLVSLPFENDLKS